MYRDRDVLCAVGVEWADYGLARRGTVVTCLARSLDGSKLSLSTQPVTEDVGPNKEALKYRD